MISEVQKSAVARGISRLCHFTPSRNLTHIAAGRLGVLSTAALEKEERAVFNQTDVQRLDGQRDHICCSIEYPNAWYFEKARAQDAIFPDWVILLIKPDYLWQHGTKFCPRNAAAEYGRYIAEGGNAFDAMFADEVVGTYRKVFRRGDKQLPACPTDQQAEVLVPDRILLADIMGVAVSSNEQGAAERARLRFTGVDPNTFNFVVAPHMFSKYQLDALIKAGQRPDEPTITPSMGGKQA